MTSEKYKTKREFSQKDNQWCNIFQLKFKETHISKKELIYYSKINYVVFT